MGQPPSRYQAKTKAANMRGSIVKNMVEEELYRMESDCERRKSKDHERRKHRWEREER